MFEYEYKINTITVENKEYIFIDFPLSNLRFFILDKRITNIYKLPVVLQKNIKEYSLITKDLEIAASKQKLKELNLLMIN